MFRPLAFGPLHFSPVVLAINMFLASLESNKMGFEKRASPSRFFTLLAFALFCLFPSAAASPSWDFYGAVLATWDENSYSSPSTYVSLASAKKETGLRDISIVQTYYQDNINSTSMAPIKGQVLLLIYFCVFIPCHITLFCCIFLSLYGYHASR